MSSTTTPSGSEIEQIRASHRVRALAPKEEGSPTASLPHGIFGFTYSPAQEETPVFAHKDYHCFEVHKLEDGSDYLLGYVNPSEAALIDAAGPGTQVTIYPDPWRESTQLVSVDLRRIVRTGRNPPRIEGNPCPLVFL